MLQRRNLGRSGNIVYRLAALRLGGSELAGLQMRGWSAVNSATQNRGQRGCGVWEDSIAARLRHGVN